MKVGTEREGHDTFVVVDGKRVGEGMDEVDANAVLGWLERGGLEGFAKGLLEERARAGAGVAFDLKELQDEVDKLRTERERLTRELNEARERERLHVTKAQDAADAVGRERDRLRRELEALRDDLRGDADDSRAGMDHDHAKELDDIARSIDAILRGGS